MDLRACLILNHGAYEADCTIFDGRESSSQGARYCGCAEGRAGQRGLEQAQFQARYSCAARNPQVPEDHGAAPAKEALYPPCPQNCAGH